MTLQTVPTQRTTTDGREVYGFELYDGDALFHTAAATLPNPLAAREIAALMTRLLANAH